MLKINKIKGKNVKRKRKIEKLLGNLKSNADMTASMNSAL